MEKNFQKISKIISEEGIFFFFLKVLRYINTNICGISKAIIFEFDLEKSVPVISTQIDFSIRRATEKDIDSMDEDHYEYDLKGKQYSKERFAKGDKCYLALHNGRIIGYVWVMKDHMELSQFNYIPLSKKRAYVYKCFVLKEYRGKRVEGAMYTYLTDMLRKDGKRFVVLAIGINNKPALKTKERDEYKIIGNLIHFKFFGLKYDYIKKTTRSYLQES